jgi:site-specific DNA-methyltransferase (adenine-specific)
MIDLRLGDCLDVMKTIPSASIDAIITDPPYGTTACKWDSVIPFEPMWLELKRIIKPNGAIVLFSSQPFTSALIMSNPKMFKYEWVWEKTQATGHLNAYKQPLKSHEIVCIFYKNQCTYNPQKTFEHKPMNSGIRKLEVQNKTNVYGKATKSLPFGGNTDRFPRTNITFSSDKQTNYLHPTQKPIALLEYLVKTYTQENEIVLDFTMGSGTTGVACKSLNRNFIGIELDEGYYNIAKERINGIG